MTPAELAAVALAGTGAGFVNALAGSGTLLTFPTLLAVGVPPVTANASNNVGLVPGAVSAVWGWRAELRGQRARLVRLVPASTAGALVGATLLLVLPAGAFAAIVPLLVLAGLLLVAAQPWIVRRVARATPPGGTAADPADPASDSRALPPVVALTGVYGGYFGAAQGILLIAALGLGTRDTLHRTNAVKNALAGVVNAVAAVVFTVVADVDWSVAGVIAGGSVVGALLGARVGRRLSPALLRAVILVVGGVALAVFLLR